MIASVREGSLSSGRRSLPSSKRLTGPPAGGTGCMGVGCDVAVAGGIGVVLGGGGVGVSAGTLGRGVCAGAFVGVAVGAPATGTGDGTIIAWTFRWIW